MIVIAVDYVVICDLLDNNIGGLIFNLFEYKRIYFIIFYKRN